MQAVATQGDYTRFQPLCQVNFRKKLKNLSYFLSTIPYNQLLHSPIIRRNSPSRGISSPNSLTDFFEHSCSRQPMKAPKFLMGLVATRFIKRVQRDSNPQGHPCPSNFQDCVFIQPDYTLFPTNCCQ